MRRPLGWMLGCMAACAVALADPASPEERYQARLKETPDTVQGHLSLAHWSEGQGLEGRAREQFGSVLRLDPEFAEAREALGYRKVAGVWMSGEDRKAMARKDEPPVIEIAEGTVTGWTEDHRNLIVEAKRNGTVRTRPRYVRVGIPLVTLELRPTMSQLIQIRTVNTATGGGTGAVFIEAPIVQMSSVRTTASVAAYP